MRSGMNDIVSPAQVHALASEILQSCLKLTDHGPKCTARNLLLVLFFAAARTASIFDACRRLCDAPSDQAVRNALGAMLPKRMSTMEQRLNQALVAKLPNGFFRRRYPMAIDTSDICYYGQPHRNQRELRRGKRKAGTSRFHCYATLYVIRRGERFTVAMTYVWKDDSHSDIVKRLLEQAQSIGLKTPRYLLLDRGFYGLDVVQSLKGVGCPFLMPVVHRGRKSKRSLSELKGTRRFWAWKKSGFSTHDMKNGKRKISVNIAVAQRRGRNGSRPLPMVFCFWGFTPGSPKQAGEIYRSRYGIETSYRQMNQGRIRTCTRDPILRLLLGGIALVLRNLWVWLHRTLLSHVRGNSIQVHLELLRLRPMLLMLQRCAEAWLGCIETERFSIGLQNAAALRLRIPGVSWNY
jgi:hypothetical protein